MRKKLSTIAIAFSSTLSVAALAFAVSSVIAGEVRIVAPASDTYGTTQTETTY